MSNKKTYSSIVTITFIDNNGKTNGVANILKDYSSIKDSIDSLQSFRTEHKNRYKEKGFGEMYGINIDIENWRDYINFSVVAMVDQYWNIKMDIVTGNSLNIW